MPRRPRVVIASRVYRPEPAAAAYRLGALADALVAAGADVEVLTTRSPGGSGPAPAGGTAGQAVVRRWPVLRDASGAVRGYLPYASFDVPLAGRLLAARRPDVVVAEPPPTTGAVTAAVTAVRRVPHVYYAADVLSAAAAGAGVAAPVVRGVRALESAVLRSAAAVLTVSDGVAAEVARLGALPGRLHVVGTGVDTTLFTPEGPVAGAGAGGTFVYAGTMSEVHGAGVFVDAFAALAPRHPTARLVMYGGGVDRERLRRRAERLAPGRVAFPGTVPAAEVAAALRGARAGLASLRPGGGYEFAFATKAFAATACGAPVVHAGPGPGGDLVRAHDLGWAVPFDAAAVAAAMQAALERADPPAERARRAAWTRREASLQAVAARAAQVVLDVAAGGGRGVSTRSEEHTCTSSS